MSTQCWSVQTYRVRYRFTQEVTRSCVEVQIYKLLYIFDFGKTLQFHVQLFGQYKWHGYNLEG